MSAARFRIGDRVGSVSGRGTVVGRAYTIRDGKRHNSLVIELDKPFRHKRDGQRLITTCVLMHPDSVWSWKVERMVL